MTQMEIGKIMAEAQKLADVKDTRVCKRTGVPEEVLTGLKAGIVSDDEAAVKVMAYLLEVMTTRYGIKMNKKQTKPIPHLDRYTALRDGTASVEEYAEVLAYINLHFTDLRAVKRKKLSNYEPYRPVSKFFSSEKNNDKNDKTKSISAKKKTLYNVSEMSEEQFEWFRWFKQGAGLELEGIAPELIINTAMKLNMSAFENDPVYSKHHAILHKCIQIRKSKCNKTKKKQVRTKTRNVNHSQRTQKNFSVILTRMGG